MTYWIFKVSELGQYPDSPGQQYVYDNTHSVRVAVGDEFIYLEKAGAKYALTGAGRIAKVGRRAATAREMHSKRVGTVFTAHLSDVTWFEKPFNLTPRTAEGRRNRRAVGLSDDLNGIGWSISMPRIDRDLFVRLLDAAMDSSGVKDQEPDRPEDWCVEDSWSLVKQRRRMHKFRLTVMKRQNYRCLVCGTRLRSVLEAAHLLSYADHPEHRANPKNGVCMCVFCHAAFDAGDITLHADGRVELNTPDHDAVAAAHFNSISAADRQSWLNGIDISFLNNLAAGDRAVTHMKSRRG